MGKELYADLPLAERVIVALDVGCIDDAMGIVMDLQARVACFKVGLELITSAGAPEAIRRVGEIRKVFLDAKLHDIPNTVGQAVRSAVGDGADIVNMHVSAGMDAMLAAVEASNGREIWGVTVLTSLGEEDAHDIYGGPSKAVVLKFARYAALAGLKGLICSAQEAAMLRKHRELDRLTINTPGIRPDWAAAGDQKRVLTPREAIHAGADRLIIGRPVTDPPEEIGGPNEALDRIFAEVEAALAERKEGA